MESKHGRFDDMEDRSHSVRQKSKVPRARFPSQYPEYNNNNGALDGQHRNGVGSVRAYHHNQAAISVSPSSSHHHHHPLQQNHHQASETDECKEWQRLIGERVCISGVKQGVLRYYGRTNFAQGFWCGVELDEAVGKNNGTVNGAVYFSCKPNHGIFAPVGKVSKLNDLSEWSGSSRKESFSRYQEHFQEQIQGGDGSKFEYGSSNLRYDNGGKFIKSSPSDPTFMRPAHVRSGLSHKSESFPYDKRSLTEQRELHNKTASSFSAKDLNYELSDMASKRGRNAQAGGASNMTSKTSTTCILAKYGYGAKNQYFGGSSNSDKLDESSSSSAKDIQQYASTRSETATVPKNPKQNREGFPSVSSVEELERFLHTPTNSGEGSPLEMIPTPRRDVASFFDYTMSEDLLSAFQSRDFPDPEDELLDNDDQMSADLDESLGILTPSQMRDFTLCPTSRSDIRGIMDFPSSESFDDINDLPEDEQVHDVSVKYLAESSSARVLEVAKKNNATGGFSGDVTAEDSQLDSMVSSTDKFLFSISQKNYDDFNLESHYAETSGTSKQQYKEGPTLNNLSAINILSAGRVKEKELPDKLNNLEFESFICGKESGLRNFTSNENALEATPFVQSPALTTPSSEKVQKRSLDDATTTRNLSDSNKMALRNFSEADVVTLRNYDTDGSSRDSLLQAESENSNNVKEKLTVSWEDCVSHGNDCMFTPVERPESVYTVASSDTGFQEDAEMDADGGMMVTSIESTDGNKRFSTASRDSCIVMNEDILDGYKIAESNSTSGYSTGLSDSCCCNDRPDDDLSGKPLTDEEIQDSVGPCDSEDAFSFQENSLSRDVDLAKETSDVTVVMTSTMCHDSTSDALCETMVEDVTLTEIHDLLLSPEDNNQDVPEDNKEKDNEDEVESEKQNDVASESSSVKTTDKTHTTSSMSVVSSSAKSTPEKRLHLKSKNPEARNSDRFSRATSRSGASCNSDDKKNKQLVATKSPKKNVMSKIKAMIEATSCKATNSSGKGEPLQQHPKRTSSVPKKSRWEAVTSKIAASLAEEKTKPKAKREIKGRVDTNLALARQQAALCRSPKLDRSGEGGGSVSPVSVSSRRPLSERNSAPNSVKDGRMGRAPTRDTKHGAKSPRPSKACITSRSNSPVAASESSTSISLTSHNSKSKIAHWKGSSSTVASSVAPSTTVAVKRQAAVPPTKPPLQTARTTGRMVTKKPNSAGNPRITLTAPGATTVRSLSPSSRASRDKRTTKKEQPGTRGAQPSPKGGPVRPPMWLSKAELTQEIQRLGTLCEARTKELNRLKMETKYVSIGFDAFAALFKYMVEDLNGLSVPALTADLSKTLKQLELTKQDLAYYEREVEEMKSHHCQELNDLSNRLFEVYQSEVAELNAKHQEEISHLKTDHQKQVEHVTATFDASSSEVKAHHEKLIASLEQEIINQREELQQLQERDIRDLEEKHVESSKLLQDHIEQLQKKCAELKQHSMSMEDAMRKDTDSKLQWVSAAKSDLEKEVESLKTVLEMKNKELHTLRVQNLEMEKQLEELPFAREKIKMLQARAEDLEALMIEKTKLERKLSTENQLMRDTYEKESKVNRRLSMENEELQWRLRQAENSIISGSFTEVPEFPESDETVSSPTKSPTASQAMSRSVFFTFVDKDDTSPVCHPSPRSQYKKITPNFSANYRTSPAKSSAATKSPPVPSPIRRGKSNSEPPQPPSMSTPRKVAKQSSSLAAKGKHSQQKRQRAGSDSVRPGENGSVVEVANSVAESMASSVSSESSVFSEHRERLLEEHREHIIHSLEILREQRSTDEQPTLLQQRSATMEKKWRSEDIRVTDDLASTVGANGLLDTEDMSRSAEFSDPKTYYHMTFPVLRESGLPDGDVDNSSSGGTSPAKEPAKELAKSNALGSVHSMSENNIRSAVEASDDVMSVSETVGSCGEAPTAFASVTTTTTTSAEDSKRRSLESVCPTSPAGGSVQQRADDKVENRWRTI